MRILLTGAGGPAAIGVARSLRHHYLIGMDCDRYALRFAETDARHLAPKASEPSYLGFLNGLISAEGIEFVHAQPDPEVAFLSENRENVRARTFLPRKETVRDCQDKLRCNRILARYGVASPETVPLPDEIALNRAWDRFMPGVGKMWVRANTGAAGRGAYLALVGKYEQVRAWIESQHGWGSFQAAEYLPGRCVTWQSLWQDGRLIASQGRERLEWHLANRSPAGITGITGVGRTITRTDVDEVGRMAVLAIDPTPDGIFGVDMKENADGVPCVTEINIGRFFTTIEFFAQAGLNFPDLYVRAATGEHVAPQQSLPEGLLWIRSMDAKPLLVHESEIARAEMEMVGV